MEAVQAIHEAANEALGRAMEGLDKRVRPVQRAYFACCYACADEGRKATEVPDCISACQAPMIEVQSTLAEAQEEFQGRIGRCHQAAGEAVDGLAASMEKGGKPSGAQMAQYAGSLRPCVAGEVAKIEGLLAPSHARVPTAMAAIKAATPAGGQQLEGKAGWFSR
jgi:hypothetical protein